MKQVHVTYNNVVSKCWKVKLVYKADVSDVKTTHEGMSFLGNDVGKYEYVLFPEFKTKKEACEIGRLLAIEQKAELFIHNRDGKFKKKNSYGNDPRTSKG